MTPRVRSVALLVGGVLLFLVAATADRLGIGGHPGLGWKQVTGIVIGVVLAGLGILRLRR